MVEIKVKLDEGAYMPEKAHDVDAGFDLRTPESFCLMPNNYIVIDTGVHMEIPEGYCGLLVSKSGLNVKSDITGTGLIDAGYTGSIKVKLDMGSGVDSWHMNVNERKYFNVNERKHFNFGDKIIQIIILPVPDVKLLQVDELDETDRGDGGFGSTGR